MDGWIDEWTDGYMLVWYIWYVCVFCVVVQLVRFCGRFGSNISEKVLCPFIITPFSKCSSVSVLYHSSESVFQSDLYFLTSLSIVIKVCYVALDVIHYAAIGASANPNPEPNWILETSSSTDHLTPEKWSAGRKYNRGDLKKRLMATWFRLWHWLDWASDNFPSNRVFWYTLV